MGKRVFKKELVGLLFMLLMSLAVGCGSVNVTNNSYDASMKEEALEETNQEMMDKVGGETGGAGIEINTDIDLNRKIIKRGYLSIETKTFNESVQKLMDEVDAIGGFTQDCYIEGDREDYRGDRRAELSVRVPKEQFDAFMNDTEQYGNVLSKSIKGEDVTDQYFDAETHMETLEIRRERLQEMLKQSGNLEDLFAIEKELAEVTYKVESLKGTLNQYDSLIDFSTIEITVNERYEYKEKAIIPITFGEKVREQMKHSFEDALDVVESLVLCVIGLIPFILFVGLPIVIILWVIKKIIDKFPKKQKRKVNTLPKRQGSKQTRKIEYGKNQQSTTSTSSMKHHTIQSDSNQQSEHRMENLRKHNEENTRMNETKAEETREKPSTSSETKKED